MHPSCPHHLKCILRGLIVIVLATALNDRHQSNAKSSQGYLSAVYSGIGASDIFCNFDLAKNLVFNFVLFQA